MLFYVCFTSVFVNSLERSVGDSKLSKLNVTNVLFTIIHSNRTCTLCVYKAAFRLFRRVLNMNGFKDSSFIYFVHNNLHTYINSTFGIELGMLIIPLALLYNVYFVQSVALSKGAIIITINLKKKN